MIFKFIKHETGGIQILYNNFAILVYDIRH